MLLDGDFLRSEVLFAGQLKWGKVSCFLGSMQRWLHRRTGLFDRLLQQSVGVVPAKCMHLAHPAC